MKALMKSLVEHSDDYVELRYHKRSRHSLVAQKGRVDVANYGETEGVGVRVLHEGAWGFAATTGLEKSAIQKAIDSARSNAKFLHSRASGGHRPTLASADLATEDYVSQGFKDLAAMSVEEKMNQVIGLERELGKGSSAIQTAKCRYGELLEEKVIVTSDGANASMKIAQPELHVSAIAEQDGQQVVASKSAGVSGSWQCLYQHPSLTNMAASTSKLAVDLLRAKYPEGGKKDVILSPAVVGLLCHEAIGHTVEADFVRAGSVAKDMIGKRVGSDLVNLYDSGLTDFTAEATGSIPFDDEGVRTENTCIIEKGILKSYLHNRESAAEFGVKPTGNARAWLFNDEPLIRMRNTYFAPGTQSLEDMIADIEDGYLVDGAGGGQADANGEFMFGCSHIWRIKNGKKVELLREATLSGIAFDVLRSVSAVSQDFLWDLGSGHCGKGQPAKVDAGGPFVRCKMHIGGRQ